LLKFSISAQQSNTVGSMLNEGLQAFLTGSNSSFGLFALSDVPIHRDNTCRLAF
jgi:hypothetical protein